MFTLVVLFAVLALPCADVRGAEDMFEPDDTADQARPIAVDGIPQEHSFDPTGDADWMKFDVAAGKSYVMWTPRSVGVDTKLELYGTNATTLYSQNDDSAWPEIDSAIVWYFSAAGTYYLKCSDPEGLGGTYRIAVQEAGKISGTLTFAAGGAPPPGVYVRLRGQDGTTLKTTGVAFASGVGQFSLTGLPAGTYFLYFEPFAGGDYFGEWYDDRPDLASATPVAVTAGQTVEVSAALTPARIKLQGTISFEAGGTPPSQVTVSVVDESGTTTKSVSTSAAGNWTYAVGGLLPGSYSVRIAPSPGSYRTEWYDNERDRATAHSITLAAGQTFTADVQLELGGKIAGTLSFAAGGSPPHDVVVRAYDEAGIERGSSSTTSQLGWRYAIGGLWTGTYTLQATPSAGNDYLREWHADAADRASASDVTVTQGLTSPVDIELDLGGSVVGAVGFAEGGTKPSSVHVSIYDSGGTFVKWLAAEAGTNWRFSLRGLTTGGYLLFFEPSGGGDYLPEWYLNAADKTTATAISVIAGRATDASAELNPANIHVAGVVSFAPGGTPPAEVRVFACIPTGSCAWNASTSAAAGWKYTLSGLMPGTWRIRFTPPAGGDYLEEWFADQPDSASAAALTLAAGQTFTADATLDLGGQIAGTVGFAGAGDRPAQVAIQVYATSDIAQRIVYTSAAKSWRYTIGRFVPGQYRVRFSTSGQGGDYVDAWHDGQTEKALATTVAVARNAVTTVDERLVVGAWISGVVTFEGTPPSGATVEVRVARAGSTFSSSATASGSTNWRYSLGPLAPGRYTARFVVDQETGYLSEWHNNQRTQEAATPIDVASGQFVTVSPRLDFGGTITGSITFAGQGFQPETVDVKIYDAEGRWMGPCDTSANETWRYKRVGLPPGTYTVLFEPFGDSDYLREWHDNAADQATARQITLGRGQRVTADVKLDLGATLLGNVSFSGTGKLPEQVTLQLYDRDNADGSYRWCNASAETSWQCSISRLPTGTYLALFWPSYGDYDREWYQNAAERAAATQISVVAGRSYYVTEVLNPRTMPNRGPNLASPGDQRVTEGRLLSFSLIGEDPDGDLLRYSAANLPPGSRFDPATGTFTWRPTYSQAATYPQVRFEATDGQFAAAVEIAIVVAEHNPLQFLDRFDDGDANGDPDWTTVIGGWTVTRKKAFASVPGKDSLATVRRLKLTSNPFSAGRLRARVTLSRFALPTPNALIVFAYRGPARYRYVQLLPGRISIGQIGSWGGALAGVRATSRRLAAPKVGLTSAVRVDVLPTGRVNVYLDEALKLSAKFPTISAGGVGLATRYAVSRFDDVEVWDRAIFSSQSR